MDVISLAAAKKFGQKANVFKYQGSCEFEELPTSGNEVGDVWNITDEFTLDGKNYDAGTNVAWDGEAWDALAASVDLSNYEEISNKVTSLDAQSTNIQYPSAKAVYDNKDFLWDIDNVLTVDTKSSKRIYFSLPNHPYFSILFPDGTKKQVNIGQDNIIFVCREKDYTNWTSPTDSGGKCFSGLCWSNNSIGNSDVGSIKHFTVSIVNGEPVSTVSSSTNMPYLLTSRNQRIHGQKEFAVVPILKSIPTLTSNLQLVHKKYVDDNVAKYTTMPTATVDTIGKIVQYIGVTNQDYISGYFYIGTSTTEEVGGENVTTYLWEQIDVQPAPVITTATSAQIQALFSTGGGE